MNYQRNISELENQAILWWPQFLDNANTSVSVIPKLLETQDDFLNIISLVKKEPHQVFDLIIASKMSANLFLKHLCVLADYGGEPIQRLGRSFTNIFEMNDNNKYFMTFTWNGMEYEYEFQALPVKGLGNTKLSIDGEGITTHKELSNIYKDMVFLLMFGSVSNACEEAALSKCEIGALLGDRNTVKQYVKERYIVVSRITGGATANTLGQFAQQEVVQYLSDSIGHKYDIVCNGSIILTGYDKPSGMPFDIVVTKGSRHIGIEISFQVTTNSTIERKAGQAADRMNLMHANGHKIAYVLDGAGNFQRKSALTTICNHSDCTVAYSHDEFAILAQWIEETLD